MSRRTLVAIIVSLCSCESMCEESLEHRRTRAIEAIAAKACVCPAIEVETGGQHGSLHLTPERQ
jgi:hypothetical protein